MKKITAPIIMTSLILLFQVSSFAVNTESMTKASLAGDSKSITLEDENIESKIPPFRVASEKPQKFAVVIGQDNYRNISLNTSINDAKRMAYIMASKMRIRTNNIRLYLDNQAAKNVIKATLSKLSKTARKKDTVFFYYSGHGVRISNNKTSALYLTSGEKITSHELYKWIAGIKSHVVVVLDCCYSAGMMVNAASAGSSASFERKNAGDIYYLTSSAANQISMTLPRYGFSRFTYYLQKSIFNYFGDVNKDGKLSLYEVYKWASKKTVDYGKIHGDKHTPLMAGAKPKNLILISI